MYLNSKDILVEFLRKRLTDPRSSRTYTSQTETFTATAAQTDFSLTPTSSQGLHYIDSVTVDSVAKTKWKDYYIDHQNKKVVFFTAMTGAESVVIVYYRGSTDWIYPDKPATTISSTSFPRIDILVVSGVGNRLGQYENDVESVIHFQIDVWAKEKQDGQVFTISSRKYSGEDLAEYFAYQIISAFEDYESDLHPALYNYIPLGIPRSMAFDITYQCHHKVVELSLRGIKVGRVS